MAACSSILAWRMPWTEEPGGLQSLGSQSRTRLSEEHTHGGFCSVEDLLNEMSQELGLNCFCSNLQCPDEAARR